MPPFSLRGWSSWGQPWAVGRPVWLLCFYGNDTCTAQQAQSRGFNWVPRSYTHCVRPRLPQVRFPPPRSWHRSQTGHVHAGFKLPPADSRDWGEAKRALPPPAPGGHLAGCNNYFGHVCGSVGSVGAVLGVAGMGGENEARDRHNLVAPQYMLPQAIKLQPQRYASLPDVQQNNRSVLRWKNLSAFFPSGKKRCLKLRARGEKCQIGALRCGSHKDKKWGKINLWQHLKLVTDFTSADNIKEILQRVNLLYLFLTEHTNILGRGKSFFFSSEGVYHNEQHDR